MKCSSPVNCLTHNQRPPRPSQYLVQTVVFYLGQALRDINAIVTGQLPLPGASEPGPFPDKWVNKQVVNGTGAAAAFSTCTALPVCGRG